MTGKAGLSANSATPIGLGVGGANSDPDVTASRQSQRVKVGTLVGDPNGTARFSISTDAIDIDVNRITLAFPALDGQSLTLRFPHAIPANQLSRIEVTVSGEENTEKDRSMEDVTGHSPHDAFVPVPYCVTLRDGVVEVPVGELKLLGYLYQNDMEVEEQEGSVREFALNRVSLGEFDQYRSLCLFLRDSDKKSQVMVDVDPIATSGVVSEVEVGQISSLDSAISLLNLANEFEHPRIEQIVKTYLFMTLDNNLLSENPSKFIKSLFAITQRCPGFLWENPEIRSNLNGDGAVVINNPKLLYQLIGMALPYGDNDRYDLPRAVWMLASQFHHDGFVNTETVMNVVNHQNWNRYGTHALMRLENAGLMNDIDAMWALVSADFRQTTQTSMHEDLDQLFMILERLANTDTVTTEAFNAFCEVTKSTLGGRGFKEFLGNLNRGLNLCERLAESGDIGKIEVLANHLGQDMVGKSSAATRALGADQLATFRALVEDFGVSATDQRTIDAAVQYCETQARTGNLDNIRVIARVLDKGVVRDSNAALTAAAGGQLFVLRTLLEEFEAFGSTDKRRLLSNAVRSQNRDCVEYLLGRGIDPTFGLDYAAYANDHEMLQMLFDRGADLMPDFAHGFYSHPMGCALGGVRVHAEAATTILLHALNLNDEMIQNRFFQTIFPEALRHTLEKKVTSLMKILVDYSGHPALRSSLRNVDQIRDDMVSRFIENEDFQQNIWMVEKLININPDIFVGCSDVRASMILRRCLTEGDLSDNRELFLKLLSLSPFNQDSIKAMEYRCPHDGGITTLVNQYKRLWLPEVWDQDIISGLTPTDAPNSYSTRIDLSTFLE